jgi:hypothetical protein
MWVRTARTTLLGLGLSAIACGSDPVELPPPAPAATHQVFFVGFAYDGVTGVRLQGYKLSALVRDKVVTGSVADDGRYVVGDIGLWQDYTITITADGYRPFTSHNAHVELPAGLTNEALGETSSVQTFHFDAYLFPTALQTNAVKFSFKGETEGEELAGQIRLRPTTASLLTDSDIDTPAGVPGQVWDNDEDLQAPLVAGTFANSSFSIEQGKLVYGVLYQVDVYAVTDYQPLTSATYRAGVEGDKTFQLEEEIKEPITVVTSDEDMCKPPMSLFDPSAMEAAKVTIKLNYQTLEFAETAAPGGVKEILDDGFLICGSTQCPDADPPPGGPDGNVNKLMQDMASDKQERGTSLILTGDTVTLSWNASTGLETKDPEDPITSVTYNNLDAIGIQRVNRPSSARSLAALLGTGSITCQK